MKIDESGNAEPYARQKIKARTGGKGGLCLRSFAFFCSGWFRLCCGVSEVSRLPDLDFAASVLWRFFDVLRLLEWNIKSVCELMCLFSPWCGERRGGILEGLKYNISRKPITHARFCREQFRLCLDFWATERVIKITKRSKTKYFSVSHHCSCYSTKKCVTGWQHISLTYVTYSLYHELYGTRKNYFPVIWWRTSRWHPGDILRSPTTRAPWWNPYYHRRDVRRRKSI